MNHNLTTPIQKKEIVIRSWITGGELQEINKPMQDIKMLMEVGGKTRAELDLGDKQHQVMEKAIETIVVSVEGETDNILEKVYALHSQDFTFLKEKIDDVIMGKDFTKAESTQEGGID